MSSRSSTVTSADRPAAVGEDCRLIVAKSREKSSAQEGLMEVEVKKAWCGLTIGRPKISCVQLLDAEGLCRSPRSVQPLQLQQPPEQPAQSAEPFLLEELTPSYDLPATH